VHAGESGYVGHPSAGGAQRNLSNTNFNDDQEWLETMYDALCQSQAKCTYEITWLPLRTQVCRNLVFGHYLLNHELTSRWYRYLHIFSWCDLS
jgi:hypothetical protein